VKAYIRTRGKLVDYTFLGDSPETHWWSEYNQLTSPERPGLLVESAETGWRACISGIPSSRFDTTKTPLRYFLVFEGEPGDREQELQDVLKVLCAWIADLQNSDSSRSSLGEALDNAYTDKIDRFLEGTVSIEEVSTHLFMAINYLPSLDTYKDLFSEESVDIDDSIPEWFGGIHDPKSIKTFWNRILYLCSKKTIPKKNRSVAVLTNFPLKEEELTNIDITDRQIAILIPNSQTPLQELKKKTEKTVNQPKQHKKRTVGIVLSALLLLLLTILLLR